MKWQFKYMTDGIVSTSVVEHPSDDITEVTTDIWNGEAPGIPEDEQQNFNQGCWLFSVEALPE